MRYFVVFLFSILSFSVAFGQTKETKKKETVSGTIVSDITLLPVPGVNIININKVKGTTTDEKGNFTIEASTNDTLHVSFIGYQAIKVRVTNDWINNATNTKIPLTERSQTLEEVVINKYSLTGYLQIDSKLAPVRENYRYSIAGLPQGYEGGENSPNAFKKIVSSVFNPADFLHNTFGKKPTEMRRLRDMKKDDTVRNLLANKFDRETLSALLGISKDEIADILERCNYSEQFITTANDLQIMDAISGCYEEYKALNRK
ncbi:carboxypeptidase-like regulatory domain-containing protein [Flavobacterium sp. Sd200]|uniref:carboxypeptidase-like regulatory domain-containing protein n=1 Tax=Flavobacterium sp. Sd200 TaxID=2692211 RepID=UPI00136DC4F2|nr:carboxypeptidase-like regulatory domain-containing protein [Flavobacterium sp. Sd200]MXN92452.1 carboxypeptidase-like regulatory domain-containing protein [Flavobacterium sp. Sd200]